MCSDLCSWPVFRLLKPEFISQIHMVMAFGIKFEDKKALVVLRNKMVFILSDLEVNWMTGCKTSVPYLKKVKDLCGKDIKTFAFSMGISHILALTKEGEVYCCDNLPHQLEEKTCKFTLMNMPIKNIKDNQKKERVVDIACGYYHSIILIENGEVYAWGTDCGEQLDDAFGFWKTPKLVLSKLVSISCGNDFGMAVTRNRKVYSWGSNNYGQLGIGDNWSVIQSEQSMQNRSMTPQLVYIPEDPVISKITCGSNHTLMLTNNGKIYAWGLNKFGQLGTNNREMYYKPFMIGQMIKERWVDIATVRYTSVAVTEEGCVYVWGECRGQNFLIPTVTSFSNVHDALAHYGPGIMHKPLILGEKPNILGCLGNAFDDSSTSDLKMQVEGKYIHVHKAILKIRSLYFKKMFDHNWVENNESVIKIREFSYVVYKEFLKFLYTDTISSSFEKIAELFDLANMCCEDNLKDQCIHRMKRSITIENVAYFYSFAVKYDTKELEEFCLRFASKDIPAVMYTKNFAKLDYNMQKIFTTKTSELR